MEKQIENHYQDKLSKMSSKELSVEICLMVHIRDTAKWYKECTTGHFLDCIWQYLMDETLSRAINQTVEPIEN